MNPVPVIILMLKTLSENIQLFSIV